MSGRIGACMRRQFLSSKRPRSIAVLSVLRCAIMPQPLLYMCVSQEVRCGRNLLPPRIAKSGVGLTLKTLGTVTVSLVDSPLAEMTVTVGLDMVSRVGVAVVSIADLGVVVVVVEFDRRSVR
jgi:hypothetical protein